MRVAGGQQRALAIHIHVCILPHPGCHMPWRRVSCYTAGPWQLSILNIATCIRGEGYAGTGVYGPESPWKSLRFSFKSKKRTLSPQSKGGLILILQTALWLLGGEQTGLGLQ